MTRDENSRPKKWPTAEVALRCNPLAPHFAVKTRPSNTFAMPPYDEVMRPLHGGLVYAALDVQMRALRHRTGAAPSTYQGLQTAFVQAEKRPVSSTREAA